MAPSGRVSMKGPLNKIVCETLVQAYSAVMTARPAPKTNTPHSWPIQKPPRWESASQSPSAVQGICENKIVAH